MNYKVVSVDDLSVTLWDGVTRDSKHRSEKAGLMQMFVGAHDFEVDDMVNISIRRTVESPKRCEVHNVYHIFGPICK